MPPVAALRLGLHLNTPGLITAGLATLFLAIGALPVLAIDDFQSDPLPISPVIGISPSSLSFSRCLTPNSQCQERTIELFNNVQDPTSVLQVTFIQISGPGFTFLGPPVPLSIPGDGTRITFTVRFCPVNGNLTPGTLTFTSPNATNSPFLYSFEGDGNLPPVCDAGGPYAGNAGIPIAFDGTASHDDNQITEYSWTFGDGTTGTGPTPTHIYPNGGTYNVSLRVIDECLLDHTCLTTATVTATPPNQPPICDAGGPYTGVVGMPIQFDGTGSSDPDGFIVSYTWIFEAGATGAGPAPSHIYNTPGPRTVSLTVRDNQGALSTCQAQVTVVSGDPVCDAGGPYLGLVNAPIRFDGTGSSDPNGTIVDYQWEFGDGSFGNGPIVTHAYTGIGDFTVRLCVEDNEGIISCCLTTARAREATAGLTPVIGVFPQPLDFGACGNIGVPAERTLEVFNDVLDPTSLLHLTDAVLDADDFELVSGPSLPVDIPGDGTSVTFTFRFTPTVPELAVGTFTLSASNATNSPAEAVMRGRGNVAPVCDAGGPYTGGTGEIILFDGSGSSDPGGSSLTYRWDFGDGTTGIGATVAHHYTVVGTFQVTLTVTDNCLVASSCTTSAVIFAALICDAGGPYFGSIHVPVQFDGTHSADPDGFIVAYNWNFGDGSTGTGPTPLHTYTQLNNYTVTLQVIDNENNSASCGTVAFITASTPVEISAFHAVPRPRAVDVSWRFRPDGDFLGFQLRRQEDKGELELHDGLLTDDDQNGAITFTDTRVQSGARYDYWLVAVERNGDNERFGPLHVEVPMPEIALRIAPNPSRPPIALTADLPRAGAVKVWVADATGRIVRTIVNEPRAAGSHALTWDGRDGRGVVVASGIYFTILEQAGEVRREKLVLVR